MLKWTGLLAFIGGCIGQVVVIGRGESLGRHYWMLLAVVLVAELLWLVARDIYEEREEMIPQAVRLWGGNLSTSGYASAIDLAMGASAKR
jgi:hypothetical protein